MSHSFVSNSPRPTRMTNLNTERTNSSTSGRRWLVTVLAIACLTVAGAADASWSTVFPPSTSTMSVVEDEAMAMAEFGGELYLGASLWSSTPSARVYKLDHPGCKIWDDVTPPWSTQAGGHSMAMVVFNNQLYVGNDLGGIWRSPDGAKWSKVSNGTPSAGVRAMSIFKNQLYVAFGGAIYRTSNGTSWAPVVGPSPALHQTCFGNTGLKDTIESMTTFNGSIYAGVGRDNSNGVQIWKSSNGANWSKALDTGAQPSGPSSGLWPGHMHAMREFKGYLYVAPYHGSELYRTDGTSPWAPITAIPFGDIYRLHEHNGTLYLGVSYRMGFPFFDGTDPLVYSSTNGTTWSAVAGSAFGDADTKCISSMTSFKNQLWIGTFRPGRVATAMVLGGVPLCTIDGAGSTWGKKGPGTGSLPKNWIDLCKLGKCPKALRHPDTLIFGLIDPLPDLDIYPGTEPWRDAAIEELWVTADELIQADSLYNEACEIEDDWARIEVLNQAEMMLDSAMSHQGEATAALAVMRGAEDPRRLSANFAEGIDGWEIEGGFAPTLDMGEPVLAGEGESLAVARVEDGEGNALLSFRASVESGRLLAAAATSGDLTYWVGITPDSLVIARGHENPNEVEVIADAQWDNSEAQWQLLQAQVEDGRLTLSVNGYGVLNTDLEGDASAASPTFALDADGVAALDDVQLLVNR